MFTQEFKRFLELHDSHSGMRIMVIADAIAAFGSMGPEVAGTWISLKGVEQDLAVSEDYDQIKNAMLGSE